MNLDMEELIDTLRAVLAAHGMDITGIESITYAYAAALLEEAKS